MTGQHRRYQRATFGPRCWDHRHIVAPLRLLSHSVAGIYAHTMVPARALERQPGTCVLAVTNQRVGTAAAR